jgi:hypothetical protein
MSNPDPRIATEARLTYLAHRAVDDPAYLARAARIVRAALARRKLSIEDLTPLPLPERNRGEA